MERIAATLAHVFAAAMAETPQVFSPHLSWIDTLRISTVVANRKDAGGHL